MAAVTVQTSAVIVYTLYDSSWSQDVSSGKLYKDQFSNRVV